MGEEKLEPVFCEDCMWFRSLGTKCTCMHTTNLKVTWRRREPNNPPSFLNRDNNCGNYERRPSESE